DAAGGLRAILAAAAGETVAPLVGPALVLEVGLRQPVDLAAAFGRGNVDEIQFGIIGAGLPVLAAGHVRAAKPGRPGAGRCGAIHVCLHVLVGIIIERPAGLGIEAARPVEFVHILPAGDEGAVRAIKRIVEAVARAVYDEFAVLAVDPGIDDLVLG